jgi:hypothetical protein
MELNWGITLAVAFALAAFFTGIIHLILHVWEFRNYEELDQEEVDELLSTDGKTPEQVAGDFMTLATKGYFRQNIIKVVK